MQAVIKALLDMLSSEKGRTVLATIAAAVVMLFMLPLIAFMGITAGVGGNDVDTQNISDYMSDESTQTLELLDSVGSKIEEVFAERGLDDDTIQKALAIYLVYLFDAEQNTDDFPTALADCYFNTVAFDTFYTNDDGYLITLTPLPSGLYTFVEVQAADGWELRDYSFTYMIRSNIDTTAADDTGLRVAQYNTETGESVPYSNAGFQIYSVSGGELVTQEYTVVIEDDEEVRRNIETAFDVQIDEDEYNYLLEAVLTDET